MATIKNGTFKDLSGSFGHSYMRVRNGKQEVCAKPSRYRLSMKKRPKAVRAMMKRLSFISKRVMADKFFYDLWKIKEIKGAGPYNKFISKNHFGKKENLDFTTLNLSPFENCFDAAIDTFSFSVKQIQVKLKPLGKATGIDTFREPFILSRGILLCTECRNTVKDSMESYELGTARVTTDLETPIQLTFESSFISGYNSYKELTVLLILATLNSEEKLVKTSVTMSCSINPENKD